jgi:MFS family permease
MQQCSRRHDVEVFDQAGYGELIRGNVNFRRLWVGNIVSPRELLTANALMSATWSVMLAVGAALGGFATALFGVQVVFWLDSATYLVSAVFIVRTVIPQQTDKAPAGPVLRVAARQIADGWQRMWAVPRVGRLALAKATWAARIPNTGSAFKLRGLCTDTSDLWTAMDWRRGAQRTRHGPFRVIFSLQTANWRCF